jgi:PAS domain S-box-containing protein
MNEQSRLPWSVGSRSDGSFLGGLTKVSMPRFMAVALPLTAVFVLGFFLEYRARVGASEARFFAQESAVIERGVRRLQQELEISTDDLLLTGDLVASTLDDTTPDRLAALERSLIALVRRRPEHLEIRYLDDTGVEILRVENAAQGPRVAPKSGLQDPRDHDISSQSLGLAAGEVFVSPMQLRVTQAAIDAPYTPVLWLATPIYDATGRRRGTVALEEDGERFLRSFPRNSERGGVQRMIVDGDGYWLQHRPEVEWGFALEHGMGFQRTFPEVWGPMAASRKGRLESSDGLFYFDSVPLRMPSSRLDADAPQENFWMLVSLVPREVVHEISVRIGTRLVVVAVPLYFGLLGVAWLLAAAFERRREAREALRDLEYVRSCMIRSALDAIIVMDKTGTTLEFNPAAQQIFGYGLEEARGRLVADLIIPPARREEHRLGLARYLATGEGPLIDRHVGNLTAIRKDGSEIPVELTICPMMVSGERLFCGFLRDLSEPRPTETTDDRESFSL